jgi:cell fate regulator YaaT (PSP1 superfamily)
MIEIDISHYQDNTKNMMPEIARLNITGLVKCSDNQIRRISKPLLPIKVIYYQYDFESNDCVILDTSEG